MSLCKYYKTHRSFPRHDNFLGDNFNGEGLRSLGTLATAKLSSAIQLNASRYNESKGLKGMLWLALIQFSGLRTVWRPAYVQLAKVQDGRKERKESYSQKCSVEYEGLGIVSFFNEDGRYDTFLKPFSQRLSRGKFSIPWQPRNRWI